MIIEESGNCQLYLKELDRYPPLTLKEANKISRILSKSKEIKEKEDAREKLILSNLRLAFSFASKYYRKLSTDQYARISLMDLVAEANVGLINAANKWEKKKGAFATYAFEVIKNHIINVLNKFNFIHLPPEHFKFFSKISKLEIKYGDTLTDEIIMKELKISKSYLAELKRTRNCRMSDADVDFLMEFISNDGRRAYADLIERERKDHLFQKIKELPTIYQEVVFLKFFGNKELTCEEIAERLSYKVTRQRIHQMYLSALRLLKFKLTHGKSVKDTSSQNIDNVMEDDIKNTKKTKGRKENEKQNNKTHREKGRKENEEKSHNWRNRKIRQSAAFVQKLLEQNA